MRWPAGMKKGVRCHELIQNTDFVPTWFDLAEVELPEKYKLDGVSIAPLFKNPKTPVRDYVYSEMGPSRSIKSKDWSYMSLRYTKDQMTGVRSRNNRVIKKLQGLSGGVSRGRENPNAFDCDQLYYLSKDPLEQNNLALNPKYKTKLKEMKEIMTAELKRFPNRPYGEFVPGGNAAPAGSFDDVLKIMRESFEPAKIEKKTKEPRKRKRQEAKN